MPSPCDLPVNLDKKTVQGRRGMAHTCAASSLFPNTRHRKTRSARPILGGSSWPRRGNYALYTTEDMPPVGSRRLQTLIPAHSEVIRHRHLEPFPCVCGLCNVAAGASV